MGGAGGGAGEGAGAGGGGGVRVLLFAGAREAAGGLAEAALAVPLGGGETLREALERAVPGLGAALPGCALALNMVRVAPRPLRPPARPPPPPACQGCPPPRAASHAPTCPGARVPPRADRGTSPPRRCTQEYLDKAEEGSAAANLRPGDELAVIPPISGG